MLAEEKIISGQDPMGRYWCLLVSSSCFIQFPVTPFLSFVVMIITFITVKTQ